MSIVTLTTDFGAQDFYAGALKGALLRCHAGLQLVDITHGIRPYNIVEGAFALSQAWHEFPEGSMHLVAVNTVYSPGPRFAVIRHAGHYFLAPDNGILTLLFDKIASQDIRFLPSEDQSPFAVKTIYPGVVAQLASGGLFEDLGEPGEALNQRINLQPVITPNTIRGTVIHVDYFENVIVNIRSAVFERVGAGRPFSLYFKRNDPITQLSRSYCDVPVGEPLCMFNSSGYLEIAVNLGRAATLLGLKAEDVVELVFE
jgi:S-adenosylmethionine hydrolase